MKTKVKKDSFGLYVIAGGWIARPFYGTIFNDGDEVKTHHFDGNTHAGVTFNDEKFNFKRNAVDLKFEYWETTGIMHYSYIRKEISEPYKSDFNNFDDYLMYMTIYCNNSAESDVIYKDINDNFWKNLKNNYGTFI